MRVRAALLGVLLIGAGLARAQPLPPPIPPPPPSPSEGCCDDPAADCCDNLPQSPGAQQPLPPPIWVAPPALVAPPPGRRDDDRFLFRLTLGAAYRWMLGESVGGASLEMMLGAHDRQWGGGAQAGLLVGRTRGGLTFMWFRFGPGFDFRLGERVHLGFGLAMGVLAIQRADSSDSLDSPSIGVHLDLGVDLVRGARGNALFFAGRLGGDALLDVTQLSAGSLLLTAGLGYRM